MAISNADHLEFLEWRDAFEDLLEENRLDLLQHTLDALVSKWHDLGHAVASPYVNTLAPQVLPEDVAADLARSEQAGQIIRWNAMAMVLQAGKRSEGIGGHIATYASVAVVYDVLMDFFALGQDLIYFQGHASPGNYARSYLYGCLTLDHLQRFRQEVDGEGLSSYPHPWLMPSYWQFPTVSMGIGPIASIYQARYLKYLQRRQLHDQQAQRVWCFCGDGEMDEPESLGAINVAVREKLDNLVFIINCNLQRLDGPVRGNSHIVVELANIFQGAGWRVIKLLWNSAWDELIENPTYGELVKARFLEIVDGDLQSYEAFGTEYFREHFFQGHPQLVALGKQLTNEQLEALGRGGHDYHKVYQALQAAREATGRPTVLLVQSVKGYQLGAAVHAANTAHQQKKVPTDDLVAIAEQWQLPLTAEEAASAQLITREQVTDAVDFINEQRRKLGGVLPHRRARATENIAAPELTDWQSLLADSGQRQYSTTMAFSRFISMLLKHPTCGQRVIPITPDETRTFGMEGLFRQVGIHSAEDQRYKSVDHAQVMYYKEGPTGQMLQEGINEAGAFCSWLAAATSYSTLDRPMVPFYIFYSMFGFQRIGDFIWAAGDARARGFLLGATSGRTTLAGEGLQHNDGHSHLLAATVPNCHAYDPCFGYELIVILQHGLKCMLEDQEDAFYYITVMNENYHHPAWHSDMTEGIIQGMYRLTESAQAEVQLLGSGAILMEVITAAKILKEQYQVEANVWSVTSFNQLYRDIMKVERQNRLQLTEEQSYVSQCLNTLPEAPVIAASDYMRQVAEPLRSAIAADYHVLGTDGFGRSDSREALRSVFEVDAHAVVYTALYALYKQGKVSAEVLKQARESCAHSDRCPIWES